MTDRTINSSHLLNILYCIKIQDEYRPSFPNEYDLRKIAVRSALDKIVKLQKNYAEIFCDKEHAIINRMIGLADGYEICFIRSFDEVKSKKNTLKVIFSDVSPKSDEVDAQTIVIVTEDSLPVADGYYHLKDFTPALLKAQALKLISKVNDEKKAQLEKLKQHVGFEAEYNEIKAATEVQDGFYNRINIAVLESLRIKVSKKGTSSVLNTNEVEKLVNRIIQIRSHIAKHLGTGGQSSAVQLYFSDTSSSLEFDRNRKNISWLLKKYSEIDPKDLMDAFNFAGQGIISEGNPRTELESEIEQERLLLDSLIALSAANNVAPVVKLPLSNNKAFQKVVTLAVSDRNGGRKTNALMKQVREAFSQYLDNWLEYVDRSPSLAIKLVSNFPLEWTYHQGLPIMVRHEVSRIPVTPGYVASTLLLDSRVIPMSLSSFEEILFISSFSDDDPIRNDLKAKLDSIKRILDLNSSATVERQEKHNSLNSGIRKQRKTAHLKIRLKWIEVSTSEELIDAVNSNPCAVTVFDLHGSHKIEGGGVIHLKNESIYASSLLGKIDISPIVILSTCDASPVDKGHESTAETFFLLGAKTVISSALPIKSDPASTFLARLLIRLQTYLPIALKEYTSIRWSTFVSGMIRRTYYSELVALLQRQYKFNQEIKTDLLFKIGINLDPLNPNWIEAANKEITLKLNISIDELRKFIETNVQFVECMKYFQLGRPELIVIFPDKEP